MKYLVTQASDNSTELAFVNKDFDNEAAANEYVRDMTSLYGGHGSTWETMLELEESDIGRWVWYVPSHAKDDRSQWERGKVKSFKSETRHAFVVYNANDNWDDDHWKDYTAASTRYDDLRFVK